MVTAGWYLGLFGRVVGWSWLRPKVGNFFVYILGALGLNKPHLDSYGNLRSSHRALMIFMFHNYVGLHETAEPLRKMITKKVPGPLGYIKLQPFVISE